MPTLESVLALRLHTALQTDGALVTLSLSGPHAFEALDALCPAELTLQDAQLRPTLLLHDDGRVFADATVGRDDERYFLMTEGPTGDEVEAWVRAHLPPDLDVELDRLDLRTRVLTVHGPWSWELLTHALGPDLAGMPYLSLLHLDELLIFRNGKTGEYAYDILVPSADADALEARLRAQGASFGLAPVDQATVDQCALENGFFNIRREGSAGLDPFELGLQWRLSRRKTAVGTEALVRLRASGAARRVSWLVTAGDTAPGDEVRQDGAVVGRVLTAGASPLLGQTVVLALLDRAWAWPGLDGFELPRSSARSVSPPLIDNRSLYVNPQRHTYRELAQLVFPPLTP